MKNRKMQVVVGGILVSLVVATVFFAIKSTAEGEVLISLENEEVTLLSQNQDLQTHIVAATSLSQINKNAKSLGLIAPEKYIYMGSSGVAMR